MSRFTTLRASSVLALTLNLACGHGGGANPAGSSPAATPDASIGPAGGTVSAAGGAVRLVVPAGALSVPVGLRLQASANAPLDPHAVSQSAYELLPAGTTFAVPATLTLRYAPDGRPSGTDESDLRLHGLVAGAWQSLGGNVDTGVHEAGAALSAAGTFGVRWLGPRGPCSSREDREFDFWLGSWNFLQGNLAPASNEITREGQGCLIEEHYQDPSGVQGRSVSLFSRLDGRWHQTYIDSRGTRLVLVGALEGRRMVLAQSATERFVWDPLDASTVRYFGERTADGGQTYSVFFDSRYTRR